MCWFAGRFIGKAIRDNELIEMHFSKCLYKMMIGDGLIFDDLQDLDSEIHNSCKKTLEADVTYWGLDFSEFGDHDTEVTNENK